MALRDYAVTRGAAARFAVYFAISAAVVMAIVLSLDYQRHLYQRTRSEDRESLRLSLASKAISRDLYEVTSDIRKLSRSQILAEYLSREGPSTRARLEQEFVDVGESARIYDQARYIDRSGREQIRVNFHDGAARRVPAERLQDKSRRYYVREALKLRAGEIYISPLDLNVEQGKIERPLKPMIRFGAPAFDAAGQLKGIIVLNYLAGQLLSGFRDVMAGSWGEAEIVNAGGYWLYAPDKKDEWGFMFGKEESFATRYPVAWHHIRDNDAGVVTTPSGLFLFHTVRPYESDTLRDRNTTSVNTTERYWKLIERVPNSMLSYSSIRALKAQPGEMLALLALVGILSLLLAALRTSYVSRSRALRESEQRFRQLAENIDSVFWLTEWPQNVVRYVSPAFERIWGIPAQRLYNDPMAWAQAIAVEDRARVEQMFMNIMDSGGYETTYRIVRPDGEARWIHDRAFLIRNEQGEVYRIAGVASDITERFQAEQELQKYKTHLEELVTERTDELQASNRTLESLNYSLAHDLRTPMRAVTSFSQILSEEAAPKLAPLEQEHLQRITRAGKHMASLLDGMSELGRIGRTEMTMATVDMSAIARGVMDELQQTPPPRSATVQIMPGLRGTGDERLLTIAIANLLKNAWTNTAECPDARIEFGAMHDSEKGGTVYYVRDNGVGFDINNAGRLFDPFQYLYRSDEPRDTGIVLASVYRIIQRHKGRIWAESHEDAGETFYFTLAGTLEEPGRTAPA